MRSITSLDLQYAHRFYGFQGEAQYLHGHTGVLTIEVEDSVEPGVNMVFPCNEIQKTAWEVLKNFDHALILREDDPLLPAILDVYEKQGIKNGTPANKMKGPAFKTELATAYRSQPPLPEIISIPEDGSKDHSTQLSPIVPEYGSGSAVGSVACSESDSESSSASSTRTLSACSW